MLSNSLSHFGVISRLIHWLSAITVFGLFALGYWMMGLDYYSQWYQTAPHWHESVGILLLLATIFRLVWRTVQILPLPIASHTDSEIKKAKAVHHILYALLFTMFITGYLVPTADDRAIEVFTWFSIPSIGELFSNQEDIAGVIHEYCAYAIITLALIHALAAIKHHFVDKDETLQRMLFIKKNN